MTRLFIFLNMYIIIAALKVILVYFKVDYYYFCMCISDAAVIIMCRCTALIRRLSLTTTNMLLDNAPLNWRSKYSI